MSRHIPVLLDEVIQLLEPKPGSRFIDATLGAAGHARVLLERTAPDGRVLGIDQDESALANAKQALQSFGSQVIFVHANFRRVAAVAAQPLTAAEVVNTASEKEIADILYTCGEERRSRPIAKSIVRSRPLHLTTDLVRAVERVTGGPRHGHIHPATRTFQALRIFVNDELKSLEEFLDSSMTLVHPGGHIAVVTFHSLE